MAITEQDRHLIYQRLEEVIGSEAAGKLMEHLPPSGWGDVATKRDLDALAIATKRDIDHLAELTSVEFRRVDEKIEGLGDKFEARLQQQTTRLVAILVPVIGLMLVGFRFV
jgi:hypothetical protein